MCEKCAQEGSYARGLLGKRKDGSFGARTVVRVEGDDMEPQEFETQAGVVVLAGMNVDLSDGTFDMLQLVRVSDDGLVTMIASAMMNLFERAGMPPAVALPMVMLDIAQRMEVLQHMLGHSESVSGDDGGTVQGLLSEVAGRRARKAMGLNSGEEGAQA